MNKRAVLISTTPTAPNGVAHFHVPPFTGLTVDEVVNSFLASGITPSDVRTTILVDLPSDDVAVAMLLLTASIGYLRRLPDKITVDGEEVAVTQVDAAFRSLVADKVIGDGAPLQVGAPSESVRFLGSDSPWTEEDYVTVRDATTLLWVPPKSVAKAALQFVLLAAVRSDAPKERFPLLVTHTGDVVDLNAVRKRSSEIRAASNGDDRSTIVKTVEPSRRAVTLQQAAACDALPVLQRLLVNEHTNELMCPRSSRHKRTADPLVVTGNMVECSVCDPYPVDILRIVMDTTGMVADDAADWIQGKAVHMFT